MWSIFLLVGCLPASFDWAVLSLNMGTSGPVIIACNEGDYLDLIYFGLPKVVCRGGCWAWRRRLGFSAQNSIS